MAKAAQPAASGALPGTLEWYLEATGKSVADVAAESGLHESTIHELLASRRLPSRKAAFALVKATNGSVRLVDLAAFVANAR